MSRNVGSCDGMFGDEDADLFRSASKASAAMYTSSLESCCLFVSSPERIEPIESERSRVMVFGGQRRFVFMRLKDKLLLETMQVVCVPNATFKGACASNDEGRALLGESDFIV